jgi:hypothetical protein
LSPVPELQPQPLPNLDKCNCKPEKKKPTKKKKRSKCYEGIYVERAQGLTKKRGKQIPCSGYKSPRKTRSDKGKKRRTPMPTYQDVFK